MYVEREYDEAKRNEARYSKFTELVALLLLLLYYNTLLKMAPNLLSTRLIYAAAKSHFLYDYYYYLLFLSLSLKMIRYVYKYLLI